MYKIPYDASRSSLYHPGDAVNFFQFGDTIHNEDALCAEMSRLAYVKEEERLKTYLDRVGYQLLKTWGYGEAGTQIFIAKSADAKRVVVAFRGTETDDPSDIVSDATLFKMPWHDELNTPLGNVHKGFADALLNDVSNGNILDELSKQIKSLSVQCDELLFTGHSLGAALATLTASCFNQAPIKGKVKLYTFGSPLIGDAEFFTNTANIFHHRFVNCCDLVTQVPPEIFGYRHTGTLRYIDRNGQLADNSISDKAIMADRLEAAADYLINHSYLPGTVWVREMADHSPINYLTGVSGLRS